jgi:hypothetical protein
MRASVAEVKTEGVPDKMAHCVASASIARHCSVAEAYGAGVGKELKDLFGAGDVEWGDLRADAAGVHCARAAGTDPDIDGCCTTATEQLRAPGTSRSKK